MISNSICKAIEAKQVISFIYKGVGRVVEPHTVGYNSKNDLMLCGWQLSGGSGVGWRDFALSGMSELVITEQSFAGARAGYNPNDRTLSRIVCAL